MLVGHMGRIDYLENDSLDDLLKIKYEMGLTSFSSLEQLLG